tara:strand:- start:2 stop:301 length:300 start_codon:yes stop_codon:yes gene_type:complete
MIMSNAFKALAHPTRREILNLLKSGPKTSGDLTDAFQVSWPTISNHLNTLKEAELVSADREGTSIRYSLNASVLEEVALGLFDLIGRGVDAKETGEKKL